MKPKKITIEFTLDESWKEYSDISDEFVFEDFIEMLNTSVEAKLVKVEREKED